MNRDPWRMRCPHGHANIHRRNGKGRSLGSGDGYWFCETCDDPRKGVERDPYCEYIVDAKTGEKVTA